MQHAAQNDRSRMLGEMPMNKLVPKISVPIMISMLVQALYNVVDSVFVARYDPDGLTAVSLAYPIQMLMIALAVGMGVGINSLISRKLGEKKPEEARLVAWNGLLINFSGFLIFLVLGLFFAPACLNMLTSETLNNAAKIRSLGTTYLSTVCTFSFGVFMSILFERALQSTGNTLLSMITQLSGAVTNIILDPIMISGMGLGVKGAAIATVIGQFTSMTVGFTLNQLKNPELRLRLKDFRVSGTALKGIVSVGLPSSVMQAIGSVMNVGMNMILSGFALEGNAAVNVLNVYFKLQSFIFMPVFGLGNGMVAIVGYNYGARLKQRVYEAIKVALKIALSIMLVGTIIFWVFPGQLMSLFESPEALQAEAAVVQGRGMHAIGIIAMRIISLCFISAAIGVTLSNVFQAVGKGTYGLIISLCRQMFVLLPCAWLLSRVSLDAVWWAFFIAEGVSLALVLLLFRKCNREMIAKL